MIKLSDKTFSISAGLKALSESIFDFFAWLGDTNLDERKYLMQPIKIEQDVKKP